MILMADLRNITRLGISNENAPLVAEVLNMFDAWRLLSYTQENAAILDEITDELDPNQTILFFAMTNNFGTLAANTRRLNEYLNKLYPDERKVLGQTSRYILSKVLELNEFSGISMRFKVEGTYKDENVPRAVHLPGLLEQTQTITPGRSGTIQMIGMNLDVSILVRTRELISRPSEYRFEGEYTIRVIE
jgi:hypothetical protein